ncbi:hypothetical protein ABMA58_15800, partial [Oceanospirillum sp. HFRX-1_2]
MAVDTRTLSELQQHNEFTHRHVGPDAAEQQAMLSALGSSSLDDPITDTVPGSILQKDAPTMDAGISEVAALAELKALADQNKVNK